MSEKKKEGCAEVIGALVIAFAFSPLLYALWGYTTSKLWGWFVVPQFGLPAMSVPSAIGISLVLSQFRRRPEPNKDKTVLTVAMEQVVAGIGNPLIALAVGYVVFRWFA